MKKEKEIEEQLRISESLLKQNLNSVTFNRLSAEITLLKWVLGDE